MIRRRGLPWLLPVVVLAVVLGAGNAFAQSTAAPGVAADRPPAPFAPAWAQFAGFDVFARKDCGRCHAVRGAGGNVGPDLARVSGDKSFFGIGASLWNHLPTMGPAMQDLRVERARLTPLEASNLIAFLFTAQYAEESGNAAAGEAVFAAKECVSCHRVGGKGGRGGPDLDRLQRANSPVSVAAAMWNHGPAMAQAMAERGVTKPTLEKRELLDVIAYIRSVAKDAGETEQVIPGTPERGRKLFADKQCAACHTVGGKGDRGGPDLGTARQHVSLSEFATRMWNHQAAMTAAMKQRRIEMPALSGQDMADVLAYLYVSRYFAPAGNAERGRALAKDKGCLGCHTVGGGTGRNGAGDFARSSAVKTPAGLIAGMWNHSRLMEAATARQATKWPTLSGQELADLSVYLASPRARR